MRKLCLFMLVCFLCLGAFSQEITLSFIGQLNNSEYCPMDSVVVTNVTKNWTETIVYPDTIIVVGGTVGNNLNIASTMGLDQNVPNPFDCETMVELTVLQREDVRMQLLDVAGHVFAEYTGSLSEGVHVFDISAANPQTYILNAIIGSHSYSIRMVNVGSGCGCSIKYSGLGKNIVQKFETTNEFELGDDMRFVGYATIEGDMLASDTVEQSLSESQCVTLHFTRSLPHVETLAASSVTNLSAILHGRITGNGGSSIIACGFYYGTSEDNLSQNVVSSEIDSVFSCTITGVGTGTTYYRAYAISGAGTGYGDVMSFSPTDILMANGINVSITCGESFNFYDSGGADNYYGANENMTATFTSEGRITLSFSEFRVDETVWDRMTVYDGNTSGVQLATMGGREIPPSVTACSGIMTIVWRTNEASQLRGWVATVSANCNDATPPVVVTLDVDNVNVAWARFHGDIIDDGLSSVSKRGFVYGTSPDSLTNTLNSGRGMGSYADSTDWLQASTVYYYRAFATNCAGTGYGDIVSFTTDDYTYIGTQGEPFVDTRDGNTYSTVIIGTQTWMAENLRYEGDIPMLTGNEMYHVDSAYRCYPNNNAENVEVYGYLYNWFAALNVCPDGWHLPSDAEWSQLVDYLGDSRNAGSMLSGNMELWGTCLLTHFSWFGTTRFEALPAGGYTGRYIDYGEGAKFWSATEKEGFEDNAYYRRIYSYGTSFGSTTTTKHSGFSVRCLRDN